MNSSGASPGEIRAGRAQALAGWVLVGRILASRIVPRRGRSLTFEASASSGPATVARNRPGPSCTATRRTASSTERPAPTIWSPRRPRSACQALAITDHDGMYGVPQFAQAAARFTQQTGVKLGTVFGAELSLELPGGPERRPRPGRPAPAGAGPRPRGIRAAVPGDQRGAARAGARRAVPSTTWTSWPQAHDGHWVILTGCRKGAVPAALAAAGPEAAARRTPRADRHVRPAQRRGRADQPRPARGRRAQRRALRAGPADGDRRDRHQQRALRGPADARLAQALAAIRARRSLDEMDGWLAASGAALPAFRRGDGRAGCAATRACSSGPPSWPRPARSTST